MILTPCTAPPPLRTAPVEAQPINRPVHTLPINAEDACVENAQNADDGTDGFLERLKVPTVILESPSISHTMAAGLSLSLLGHTLFLKNQVPFPVAQLSRMPGGKSNPKVTRKRDELLATFDILESHLRTTFVALSTAYARCKSASSLTPSGGENAQIKTDVSTPENAPRGTAHLLFVLGSSVGTARARILLTIDGLDVKVWGSRDQTREDDEDEDGGESQSEEEDSEDEDTSKDDESGSDESKSESDTSDEDVSGSDDEESDMSEAESSALSSGPPPSRTPSPEPPAVRSLAPSPESLPSPLVPQTPLGAPPTPFFFAPPAPPPLSSISAPRKRTFADVPTASTSHSEAKITPPISTSPEELASNPASELSYAQEQQALRAAERLLSRTLMNAWVDGEGDMSSELAPTQTHIYLRAPRRFMHPAWAARQNLTRTLDGVLDTFLEDVGAVQSKTVPGTKQKKRSGVRTEGAWIGCRSGSAFVGLKRPQVGADEVQEREGEGQVGDEEDEEIWWAWEGKIVGFADW